MKVRPGPILYFLGLDVANLSRNNLLSTFREILAARGAASARAYTFLLCTAHAKCSGDPRQTFEGAKEALTGYPPAHVRAGPRPLESRLPQFSPGEGSRYLYSRQVRGLRLLPLAGSTGLRD